MWSGLAAGAMDCHPNCMRARFSPIDPVFPACGDVQVIACLQVSGLCLIGKAQQGFALDQQNPFSIGLLVPEPRRAGLASRHDPLHDQPGSREQGGERFVSAVLGWKIGEQIVWHGG